MKPDIMEVAAFHVCDTQTMLPVDSGISQPYRHEIPERGAPFMSAAGPHFERARQPGGQLEKPQSAYN
jgi:hypothetical protein